VVLSNPAYKERLDNSNARSAPEGQSPEYYSLTAIPNEFSFSSGALRAQFCAASPKVGWTLIIHQLPLVAFLTFVQSRFEFSPAFERRVRVNE